MVAVAAGDEFAVETLAAVVRAPGDEGAAAVEAADGHLLRRVDGFESGRGARLHQVARQFGLAIDEHRGAASERAQVDVVALAVDQQLEAVVDQSLASHARADAHLLKQVGGDLLEDSGADAAPHVFGGLALDDDVVDAGLVEQLSEQQARRPRADDGDLGTHEVVSGSE